MAEDKWTITYHDYDDTKEKTREALTSVGNGYFGTRGAMEEAEPVTQGWGNHISYLVVKTNQSNIEIEEASKLLVSLDTTPIQPEMSVEAKEGSVYTSFDVELKAGNVVTVDKFVAIYTSKDSGVSNALESAKNGVAHIQSFDEILQKSGKKW